MADTFVINLKISVYSLPSYSILWLAWHTCLAAFAVYNYTSASATSMYLQLSHFSGKKKKQTNQKQQQQQQKYKQTTTTKHTTGYLTWIKPNLIFVELCMDTLKTLPPRKGWRGKEESRLGKAVSEGSYWLLERHSLRLTPHSIKKYNPNISEYSNSDWKL